MIFFSIIQRDILVNINMINSINSLKSYEKLDIKSYRQKSSVIPRAGSVNSGGKSEGARKVKRERKGVLMHAYLLDMAFFYQKNLS